MGNLLLPYHDPILGRMWVPSRTNAFWDFARNHGTNVPDDAQARKTRTFTNLVTNGNFVNTTGWTPSNATNAVANNILSNTGNGAGASPNVIRASIQAAVDGRQYYVKIRARVTNASCMNLVAYVTDADYTPKLFVLNQASPANGTWYEGTGVITMGAGNTGDILLLIYHQYTDAATANGKVMEVDGVYGIVMYDLTTASAVDAAANITQLLADNGVTYHDGAYALQYQNRLTLSGASDAKWGLKLDGTDDYLYSMNSPQVDITTPPIHLQALIKVNTSATTGWIMNKNTSAANDCQYGLLYNTANSTIDAYFNGTAVATTSTASVTAGKWYMVSVDYDGAVAQCYINGKANGSAAAYTATLTSAPYFRIGCRETAAQYFNGWVDSAAVIPSADKGKLREFERFIMRRKGILS